jgi:hypothetical protein
MNMEFDEGAFKDLVTEKGERIFSISFDEGSMANNGTVFINKYGDSFWAYDYESNFGGPYESLKAALEELQLEYTPSLSLEVSTDLSPTQLLKLVKFHANKGDLITINDEYWEFVGKNRLKPYENPDEEDDDSDSEF